MRKQVSQGKIPQYKRVPFTPPFGQDANSPTFKRLQERHDETEKTHQREHQDMYRKIRNLINNERGAASSHHRAWDRAWDHLCELIITQPEIPELFQVE